MIERAVVLCRGEYIDQEDLLLSKLSTAGDTVESHPMEQRIPALLARRHRAALTFSPRSTTPAGTRAARPTILGIERSTLDRKIRRYSLADDDAPSGAENGS